MWPKVVTEEGEEIPNHMSNVEKVLICTRKLAQQHLQLPRRLLDGRTWTFRLHPGSCLEMSYNYNPGSPFGESQWGPGLPFGDLWHDTVCFSKELFFIIYSQPFWPLIVAHKIDWRSPLYTMAPRDLQSWQFEVLAAESADGCFPSVKECKIGTHPDILNRFDTRLLSHWRVSPLRQGVACRWYLNDNFSTHVKKTISG